MKTYTGVILHDNEIWDVDRVVRISPGDKLLDLGASLKVANHSPTGFCWGYGGSGPAQLSLALLMDHFNGDVERAKSLYQAFKFKVIARLPMDENFTLTGDKIQEVVDEIETARRRMQP